MIDMTAYVAQAAERYGWTAAQQQIVLQQFQNGVFQDIAQTANNTAATASGGATGAVWGWDGAGPSISTQRAIWQFGADLSFEASRAKPEAVTRLLAWSKRRNASLARIRRAGYGPCTARSSGAGQPHARQTSFHGDRPRIVPPDRISAVVAFQVTGKFEVDRRVCDKVGPIM